MTSNYTVVREGESLGALVLSQGDRKVGRLDYRVAGSVIQIDYVFVDSSLRGRGLGVRLVDAAVAWARDTGRTLRPVCGATPDTRTSCIEASDSTAPTSIGRAVATREPFTPGTGSQHPCSSNPTSWGSDSNRRHTTLHRLRELRGPWGQHQEVNRLLPFTGSPPSATAWMGRPRTRCSPPRAAGTQAATAFPASSIQAADPNGAVMCSKGCAEHGATDRSGQRQSPPALHNCHIFF
jgi:predicted GNAT family acetyltransferase